MLGTIHRSHVHRPSFRTAAAGAASRNFRQLLVYTSSCPAAPKDNYLCSGAGCMTPRARPRFGKWVCIYISLTVQNCPAISCCACPALFYCLAFHTRQLAPKHGRRLIIISPKTRSSSMLHDTPKIMITILSTFFLIVQKITFNAKRNFRGFLFQVTVAIVPYAQHIHE